ncbi:lectin C-type domain-containing protein [Saccharata proteae CBS 121410]|uniref:Maintenance of telomere capping protein 6 n=1 Tax=Saccharata proteae CBS 121410 TaxID=1314787 RepID=A0A6A5YD75_9PEZI|nr:lectin C-type domain-containing protein [Saccharata proteae CBS 121410]
MPSQYAPADGADPVSPYSTALLSQRDLQLSIPVNFVTGPVISLSQACFPHDLYQEHAASVCLSNLLAAGFKRIVVDLYWDAPRTVWSLCPAEIPDSASNEDDSQSISIPTTHLESGETIVQVGPYNCSATLDVSVITEVLEDFLESTSDTVHAELRYFIFNIHAAASSSSPTEPAQAPAANALPAADTSLGNLISTNLSSYLYTPSQLREDRSNLNSSWYGTDIAIGVQPAASYIEFVDNDGVYSTPDGWPSEGTLEFGPDHYRVLASFGQIDPQMANYTNDNDDSIIFPEGTFQATRTITTSSNGTVTSGCFFDADVTTLTGSTNNSWAISSDIQIAQTANLESFNTSLASISNISACGVSPFVNQTMENSSADSDWEPYQLLAYSSVWSWAIGEPRNVTNHVDDASELRCATMRSSLSGHWALTDCTSKQHAACRVRNDPYSWQISEDVGSYSDVSQNCPQNSSFDAPRTGLENSYVFAALRRYADTHDIDTDDPSVWVDFNSLDVQGCWVVGSNSSCPYSSSEDAHRNRLIVIPTVAAVIVFLLAALTIFIKCAANRQNTRRTRRRKGEEGWDYEGVPS